MCYNTEVPLSPLAKCHVRQRLGSPISPRFRFIPMLIRHVSAKSILTASKLPGCDFAANPYVGCPHACRYCYAVYMKRFTDHPEPWGTFLDVKEAPPLTHPEKYRGKTVFLSSVTDAYNPYEAEFRKTRELLEQLVDLGVSLHVTTKSNLVLRDLDLLKQFESVQVAFSINTLDETFRRDMDRASTIAERIEAMQILHDNGIPTITFISPIFPVLTRVFDIIEATHDSCDEIWLENLNLRACNRGVILGYIHQRHPQLSRLYDDIYLRKNHAYWHELSRSVEAYAVEHGICLRNYLHTDVRADEP